MAWAPLYSGVGMRRAESTATVHSVDVSLQSSPMLRSFPRGGNPALWVPTWGSNGRSVALDFSGTFFGRGYGLSIPNLITLARILAVPVILWAVTSGEVRIAFALFLAAGLSDLIDGFLAKRFGMATELGAYLDPLADKAMIISIYVALGIVEAIPRWLVILVVSRDIMIVSAVILSWLVDKPVKLQPIAVSKLNTVAQIVYA